MEENENQVTVLNDLVKINNDRIEGYHKASENFKDTNTELLSVFNGFAMDSQNNKEELIEEIRRLGGTSEDGTTMSGKIYRAWMDVKATFGGNDAEGILKSCEGGEDAAKNAYKGALESNHLDPQAYSVVVNQQQKQLQAHDKIKALRDQLKD
ncbi:MAG: PA2169 family four-helix-bundle protein [Flavobacteriia bacterium]|nr:PA2169 family four-helix-bundle protein [Flavobacteriia bacterium]OJX39400.1 MAG: aldehyde dehydrogenase [Flavobacteriia bacterium 40-80]